MVVDSLVLAGACKYLRFERKIAALKPGGDTGVSSVQYNLPKADQNADDALRVISIRMKPSWTISPGNSSWV